MITEQVEKSEWRTGTVAEFLELTPEQNAMVEIRFALVKALRQHRKQANMTQAQLAERIGTGQAAIARIENGDRRATIDLMITALLATGATTQELASVFGDISKQTGMVFQTK